MPDNYDNPFVEALKTTPWKTYGGRFPTSCEYPEHENLRIKLEEGVIQCLGCGRIFRSPRKKSTKRPDPMPSPDPVFLEVVEEDGN